MSVSRESSVCSLYVPFDYAPSDTLLFSNRQEKGTSTRSLDLHLIFVVNGVPPSMTNPYLYLFPKQPEVTVLATEGPSLHESLP